MASATPHDGKAASFASLMNMLNPTAIANPDDYGPDDIKGLFLRRYKKHIQDQVSGSFLERQVSKHAVPASPEEEAVYERLADARFVSFDQTRRIGPAPVQDSSGEVPLLLAGGLSGRPFASVFVRSSRTTGAEADKDRVTLGGIAEALERIGPDKFHQVPAPAQIS